MAAAAPTSARSVIEPGYTAITFRLDISNALLGLGIAPLAGYPANVSIDTRGRAVFALPIVGESTAGKIRHEGSIVLASPTNLEGALVIFDPTIDVRTGVVTGTVATDGGTLTDVKLFRITRAEPTSDGIFNARLQLTGNKRTVGLINDILGTHLAPKQRVGVANVAFLPTVT